MSTTQSRLEHLIESSSHARRFSTWYEINKPVSSKSGFSPFKTEGNEEHLELSSRAIEPLSKSDQEWHAMEEEIKAASYILRIENDEELDDFVPYTKDTLNKAINFLRRQMIHAHSAGVFGMGIPRISPADRGGIDLFWEMTDRTLLINFPNGASDASYFGKKPKSKISGEFDPSEARVELVSWLADR